MLSLSQCHPEVFTAEACFILQQFYVSDEARKFFLRVWFSTGYVLKKSGCVEVDGCRVLYSSTERQLVLMTSLP
jgi:hypothetical protein